jgi:hypothetical protein
MMVDIFELTVRVVDLMKLDGDVDQALVSLRGQDEGEIEIMLEDSIEALERPDVDAALAAPMIVLAKTWREQCRSVAGVRELSSREEDLRAFLASVLCTLSFATPTGTQPLLYEGEGLLLHLWHTAPRVASLLAGGSEGGTERLFHGDAQLLHPQEAALVRSDLAPVPEPRMTDFPDVPGAVGFETFRWETPRSFRPRERQVADPIRMRVPGGEVAVFSLQGLARSLTNLKALAGRALEHGSLRIAIERTRPSA